MWAGSVLKMRGLLGPALRCAASSSAISRAVPRFAPQPRPTALALGFGRQLSGGSAARPSGRSPAPATQAYQFEAAAGERMGAEAVVGEVDFNPALSNSVTVMGKVGAQPELRFLESGNKVTTIALALWSGKGETQWVDVDVWGPLADRVAAEVQKGQTVAVSGRLKVNTWDDRKSGEKRKAFRVVANTVNKVKSMAEQGGYSQQRQPAAAAQQGGWGAPAQQQYQQQQQQQPEVQDFSSPSPVPAQAAAAGAAVSLSTAEEMWMNLFEDPTGWYDNRPRKSEGAINARSPDFKRKDGGRDSPALWVDSKSTPAWVRGELARLDSSAEVLGGGADLPPF